MEALEKQVGLQLELLLATGRERFPFLPWHTSEDPFVWLVAELLLRRTTRTAAAQAFLSLIEKYPSPASLARATQEDVKRHVARLGLGNTRSKHLLGLAQLLVHRHNGEVPDERRLLLELPGVGPYVADAVLLHAFRKKALPLDAASQRVIRRLWGLAPLVQTRHAIPEKDQAILRFRDIALAAYDTESLRMIHFGLLALSWDSCRRRPKCAGCALKSACIWRLEVVKVDHVKSLVVSFSV